MSMEELKGINHEVMGVTFKGTKRNLKGVVRIEDMRAQLMEHLPVSLTKEETLIIKELLHLLLPLVALKFKNPWSRQ